MYSLGICGASGRVGVSLLEYICKTEGLTLAAAVVAPEDPLAGKDTGVFTDKGKNGILFETKVDLADKKCDVFIDFSHPLGTAECLVACQQRQIPLIIGTTGHSGGQQRAIEEAARKIPILQAANMSVGVNICLSLIRQAVSQLDEDYDIEIFEAHHKHKIDAPSGTALSMARVAAAARNKSLEELVVKERTNVPRRKGSIGFQVLRGGDLVGEHAFRLVGEGENVEIHHKARSRSIFVQGAVKAALWLLKQEKAGLYSMADIFTS